MPEPRDRSSPASILADAGGSAALADLGALLRTRGYDLAVGSEELARVPLFCFALARPLAPGVASDAVGPALLGRLLAHGLACEVDGRIAPSVAIFAAGPTYALVPPHRTDGDRVYLGGDAGAVVEAAWRRGVGGRRAADLGTGTGFLAAAFARRYESVVAVDVMERCVATAALTRLLNPAVGERISVVRADVAGPLRRGSFDFVVANPPWVAAAELDEAGQPCVYADGGPTGFELPHRFLCEAAELLAPGGVAVLCCLDLTYQDGRMPLADTTRELAGEGFDVQVEPTAVNDTPGFVARHLGRQPALASLRHVAVTVRRSR